MFCRIKAGEIGNKEGRSFTCFNDMTLVISFLEMFLSLPIVLCITCVVKFFVSLYWLLVYYLYNLELMTAAIFYYFLQSNRTGAFISFFIINFLFWKT